MSKPDWADIKADYVTTNQTLAEVQQKWGLNRGTLSARATRENWNDAKRQFAADLERERLERLRSKWAAEKEQFDEAVFKVARANLGVIAKQMQSEHIDASKLHKLASTLETVHRVGNAAVPSR